MTSSKTAYVTGSVSRSPALRAVALRQATTDLYLQGDTQKQFWLRLCGVSGTWCTQGFV